MIPAERAPGPPARATAAAANGRVPRELGRSLLKLVAAELAAMPVEPAQRGAAHRTAPPTGRLRRSRRAPASREATPNEPAILPGG